MIAEALGRRVPVEPSVARRPRGTPRLVEQVGRKHVGHRAEPCGEGTPSVPERSLVGSVARAREAPEPVVGLGYRERVDTQHRKDPRTLQPTDDVRQNIQRPLPTVLTAVRPHACVRIHQGCREGEPHCVEAILHEEVNVRLSAVAIQLVRAPVFLKASPIGALDVQASWSGAAQVGPGQGLEPQGAIPRFGLIRHRKRPRGGPSHRRYRRGRGRSHVCRPCVILQCYLRRNWCIRNLEA